MKMIDIPIENSKDKKWFALYVNSRAEKKVVETLLKKDIIAYTPIIKTLRQWSDRKKMIDFPLLSGYVFVNVSHLEFDLTLKTKGVVGFVRVAGERAVVRDEEIARLKQLVELGYQLEASGLKHNFKEGDKIKITSGPLKNIEGFISESTNGKTIVVILESIGQVIKVKLPEELLIPVN